MKTHKLEFKGALLERGFWLYIWSVKEGKNRLFYVGRTGDNSSVNAASPFARTGQHLDVRQWASANMLLRHIRAAKLNPLKSHFKLIAFGPIYSEQKEWESHKKFRNKTGALESALAEYLRSLNFRVVGDHPRPQAGNTDKKIFQKIKAQLVREII